MTNLIAVNLEYAVLLCAKPQCRRAQTVKGIEEHFRKFHHEKPAIRREISKFGRALAQRDVRFLRHYSIVELPADGLAPQAIVAIVDGFSCNNCCFYTVSRANIRIHVNKQHSRRGEEDELIFAQVRLQSWYGPKRERYWVVDEGAAAVEHVMRRPEDDGMKAMDEGDEIEEGIWRWQDEAMKRRLRLQTEPLAYELDAWLNFTKWHAVLSKSKHDMLQTYRFLRYPEADDKRLCRLLRAWEVVRTRALDTLENVDHKDALKWWVSPKNEVASQNPFELPQNAKTLGQYSRIWEQFLCYMVRTVPALDDDDDNGETETGVIYTQDQRDAIEDIHDDLDDDDSDVGLATLASNVMRLCRLVVTQDLSATKLYDSPLMHYLAVRGIDKQTESFRGPMQYTSILAGMLWIVRLLALEMVIPSRPWLELGIAGKAEVASVKESVESFRLAHLVEGSFSPASSILTQLAKGKKDNSLHHSPSNIHWAEDKETIYFVGRPVELAKIGPMCDNLVDELKELMVTLAFEEPLPTIKLGSVVDSTAWNQQFRKAGFDFTKHSANRHLNVGYSFNLQRARTASGELKMLGNMKGGGVAWIDDRKHWYLIVERSFLRKLMVAVHIMAGQPARGPELGSIKVCNSTYSARNIVVLNGRICIMTMYDKSRRRRGNTDYVIRVLPDNLSQLVSQYIVYIRPFARVLDMRESEYLFADVRGPWAGDQLSWELASETTKHLGVRLTVRAWRHIAIGIAVQWLGSGSKMWEKDGEEGEEKDAQLSNDSDDEGNNNEVLPARVVDHIMVRQASHGQRVAQSTYAIDGAFLHRLGPQLIAAFEHASVAWHKLFEWKSEGVESKGAGKRTRSASWEPGKGKQRMKRTKVEASEKVGACEEVGAQIEVGQDEKDAGEKALRESEAMRGLQRVYGPLAAFKSEGQANAMELVHDPCRTSNIIVLPTSAGKSALFLSVAAMCTHRSVIVVVPFVQLIADIVQRALDCGLSCVEWQNANSSRELEQLVVVSADRAASDSFLHYARGLELGGLLAHLFFDECHVAVTDTSYRKQLRQLWQLRYLNCPFSCLTATLMVALEGQLRKQLMLPETEIFRRSTMRSRIRYSVVNSRTVAPMKIVVEMVKQRPLASGKKGVIYVRTYHVGEVVSTELNCPFYKATAVDKSQTLQAWIDKPGGWIVATGALGTGINIDGINEVIHVDRPYGLTSFAQQSGRAGRSGEISNSVVITRVESSFSSRSNALQSDFTVEKIDEEAMTEYIRTKSCRRSVLAKHFDQGSPLSCREHAEEVVYCDYCEAKSLDDPALESLDLAETQATTATAAWANPTSSKKATKPTNATNTDVAPKATRYAEASGQQTIARSLYREAKDDEDMFAFMLRLKQNCIFCTLISMENGPSIEGSKHTTLNNCMDAIQSQCYLHEFHRWRAGIDMEGFRHCYICGLPQDICRFVETGTPCEYPRVMLLSLFVLHNKGMLAGVVDSVGFRGKYEKDLWDWMKREEQGKGLKWESNLMRVWREVCHLFKLEERQQ